MVSRGHVAPAFAVEGGLLLASVGVCALDLLVGIPSALLALPALLLVLLLPGLSLQALVLPEIRGPRRLPVGVVLSAGIAIALGFALHAVRDLERGPWLAGLAVVSATLYAARRPPPGRGEARQDRASPPPGRVGIVGGLACGAVVLALLTTSIVLARRSERDIAYPPFTSLSAAPPAAGAAGVDLQVTSHERTERRYRLAIVAPGGERRVHEFSLLPGQSWRATTRVAVAGMLSATLTGGSSESPESRRRVRLRVTAAQAGLSD